MKDLQSRGGRFAFGEFTVDAATGELRRGHHRVHVQDKPFLLLVALLQRPGDPVTREELRERLWPGGIHVDYEQGLGNAVQKLRHALGDSAESPLWVETLPRRGYRFIGELKALSEGRAAAPPQPVVRAGSAVNGASLLMKLVVGLAFLFLFGVALRPMLPGPEHAMTSNPDAWEAYLRGRHFEESKTPNDMPKSVEYFRQAVEADPQFALAWAGLSDAYRFMGALGLLSRDEAYRRSTSAARRALELDGSLAEAHAALAETSFRFGPTDYDAGPGFRRALALRPESATIRHWYANYLADRGHLDDALVELQRARHMAPLNLHINVDLGFLLYDAGQVAAARQQLRRTLELDPRYPKAHFLAGYIEWKENHYQEAVAAFRRVTELAPDTPKFLHALAVASIDAGRRDEARAVMAQIRSLQGTRFVEPEMIARLQQRLDRQAASAAR